MTTSVKLEKNLAEEWWYLELDIDQSIRYHRKRAIFYNVLKSINSFVIIFIGGTAFSGTLTTIFDAPATLVNAVLGPILALFGALDFIIGYGEKYKYHSMTRCSYAEIYKRLSTKDASVSEYRDLYAQYLDLRSDEEGRLRLIDMLARNEVIISKDLDRSELVKLSVFRRMLANFARFENYIPPRIGDLAKRRLSSETT